LERIEALNVSGQNQTQARNEAIHSEGNCKDTAEEKGCSSDVDDGRADPSITGQISSLPKQEEVTVTENGELKEGMVKEHVRKPLRSLSVTNPQPKVYSHYAGKSYKHNRHETGENWSGNARGSQMDHRKSNQSDWQSSTLEPEREAERAPVPNHPVQGQKDVHNGNTEAFGHAQHTAIPPTQTSPPETISDASKVSDSTIIESATTGKREQSQPQTLRPDAPEFQFPTRPHCPPIESTHFVVKTNHNFARPKGQLNNSSTPQQGIMMAATDGGLMIPMPVPLAGHIPSTNRQSWVAHRFVSCSYVVACGV
jgi:hypothetical protein